MKKIILTMFCLSIFISANASICSNFYINPFYGLNAVESFKENEEIISLKQGYVVGASIGYKCFNYVRIESEFSYRQNSFDRLIALDWAFPASGNLKKMTLFKNAILDIPLAQNSCHLFGGLGVGYEWNDFTFTLNPIETREGIYTFKTIKNKPRGLIYQSIAGMNFLACKFMSFGVEYRYLFNNDFLFSNHSLTGNVRGFF